jgi:hypothetical protein
VTFCTNVAKLKTRPVLVHYARTTAVLRLFVHVELHWEFLPPCLLRIKLLACGGWGPTPNVRRKAPFSR